MVEVDGVRHTARHVVVATGADPDKPPVPGLRDLDGVWTNREVTAMTAVPRHLLILGGGPVGAEMAQAVRRLGGDVSLVEAAEHVLAREPAPLGHALGEQLRRDGIELILGVQATHARRDGEDYVLTLEDGRELRGDRMLAATGRRPRVPVGLDRWRQAARRHRGRHAPERRGGPVGHRRRTGIRLLTHVGKYQGEVVASNILGEPREAHYEAIPNMVYTDPQAAAVGATQAPFSATVPCLGGSQDGHVHPRRPVHGLCDLAVRRQPADRRLRAGSRGRRMAAAGHAGHPGPTCRWAVLRDVIQPFPTFSEIYVAALKALRGQIKESP